jgi:uncharacterized membrane protein
MIRNYPFHYESRAVLSTPLEDAFDYLDDFRKLSSHMESSSGMMLGSKMEISTDGAGGRAVGSHVAMRGRVCGISLTLEEVVVRREPPRRKMWETVAADLLVIGDYRLGFELEPTGHTCAVRVFIDYNLPSGTLTRWLGIVFARSHARWCTQKMAEDAARHFADVDRNHASTLTS